MKLWISRIFLYTGLVLLLFHTVSAHHHDDDHHYTSHQEHDALEHANIDHVFSFQTDHSDVLQAIIPDLVYKRQYDFSPYSLALHIQPVIVPEEPYPPGWGSDKTILRGPPLNCQ